MKTEAFVLTRNGAPDIAFERQSLPLADPAAGEIRLDVTAFGINFADIMARLGYYGDCPPLPTVVGYEVFGTVESVGAEVSGFAPGDTVVAFTHFGGYSRHINVPAVGAVKLPADTPPGEALALATQYSTAWYCAHEAGRIREGDQVLVHAAAGGVGIALVQLAKLQGATIFGTAGSDKKISLLREQGVDHPINYRQQDFDQEIRKILGAKMRLDVVFDAVGGKNFKKGWKLLGATGYMVCFGAATRTEGWRGKAGGLKTLLQFGWYNPAFLMMGSRTIAGVNMLRVGEHKPALLKHCMQQVVNLYLDGKIKPVVGGVFSADELADAHAFVENRESVGKVIVEWRST